MRLLEYSVNIVALVKHHQRYGMACSWAMQTDDDKLLLLMGSQSLTGLYIEKGDIIGISSLNQEQHTIADTFGRNHSNQLDKFVGIHYQQDGTAILIADATSMMKAEVLDILYLNEMSKDKLVYVKIIYHQTNKLPFLLLSDLE